MMLNPPLDSQKVSLTLDTSGASGSVCLFCDRSGQAYRAEHSGQRGHDQWVFGLMDQVLKEAQRCVQDIEKIIVVVGPGSFTGLRIAGAAAKSLSMALGIPVYGVQTFDAIFYQLSPQERGTPISIIVPTQTGLFNVKHFGVDKAIYEQLSIQQVKSLLEGGQKCIFAFEDPGLKGSKVHVVAPCAWGAFEAFRAKACEPFSSLSYFHQYQSLSHVDA